MRAISLLIVPLIGLGVLSPSVTYAAVVETIIDANTAEVLGSITFPALSGSTTDGVVFSYGGFSQSEITSIDWTLNPTTDAVTALDLHALEGDAICPVADGVCSNGTLTMSSSSASEFFKSCDTTGQSPTCEEFERSPQNIAFKVTSIPEPATWFLGLTGFLGLGAWRFARARFAVSAAYFP
jgi:hypothetical protein